MLTLHLLVKTGLVVIREVFIKWQPDKMCRWLSNHPVHPHRDRQAHSSDAKSESCDCPDDSQQWHVMLWFSEAYLHGQRYSFMSKLAFPFTSTYAIFKSPPASSTYAAMARLKPESHGSCGVGQDYRDAKCWRLGWPGSLKNVCNSRPHLVTGVAPFHALDRSLD